MAMKDDGEDVKLLIEPASQVGGKSVSLATELHTAMLRDCTQAAPVRMNAKRQCDGEAKPGGGRMSTMESRD